MPRYYFDHRDGNSFISDDEGLEFDGIKAVRDEATRALAGIAKDELPGSVRREIAIEVRDEASRPVLRAALWFEVQTLA
jgi:hypothetical protein